MTAMDSKDKKVQLEEQFRDMVEKARQLYPGIDKSITIMNNITAQTTSLQDYLNLTNQTPSETSNNQVTL